MDIKNYLVTNINIFNNRTERESNSSEYKINNSKIISTDIKSDFSSNKFDESTENKQYTKKELDDALKKMNNFLKDEKTHAEYSVHEDFGTLMIKIIDDESDKVILEIPPKNILDIVASMCKQVGLLDKKA